MKQKRSIKNTKLGRGLSKLPRPSRLKGKLKVGLPAPGPLETLGELPKITNETVAEHREAVLKGARKYIYPLQHSRGAIIKVSIALFIALIVAFFVYCGLALYKFQSTSKVIYEVTRVIPFPIAKAGSHFVSYESYLFELRHLKHYYETQQKENFADPQWSEHFTRLKQDSLNKVIEDAYVKELAAKNNISVSNREVEDQIALVKSQNRLGSSDQMLEDVLDQFWDWNLADFKRELKSQLLAQKVASKLDTATHERANAALVELQGGADFAATAKKYSDDTLSKDKGGVYEGPVGKTDRDVPPHVVAELFKLSPNGVSDIVETGYTLEILKNNGIQGEKINAAHISFKIQPIETYVKPLEKDSKIHRFIKIQ